MIGRDHAREEERDEGDDPVGIEDRWSRDQCQRRQGHQEAWAEAAKQA